MPENAITQWKDKQRVPHSLSKKSERRFSKDKAQWYQDWVLDNDYVEITMPYLQPYLHDSARILEIGPGTGAFTIPLARSSQSVVAVESAPMMQKMLKENLSLANIQNVTVIENKIEKAIDDLHVPFDLIFASHSLYNILEIDQLITKLLKLTPDFITLIGVGDTLDWQHQLNQKYMREDKVSAPDFTLFYNLLLEMNIIADVKVFSTSFNYVFDTQDDLLDFWQDYFHVDDSLRGALFKDVEPLIEVRDQQACEDGRNIGIYSKRNSALVFINRDRNIISPVGGS